MLLYLGGCFRRRLWVADEHGFEAILARTKFLLVPRPFVLSRVGEVVALDPQDREYGTYN